MGKPIICIAENKAADQLCSNCTADQRHCFRYSDSTLPLLLISKVSSFYLSSMPVQTVFCRTWSKPKLLVFSCTSSNDIFLALQTKSSYTCLSCSAAASPRDCNFVQQCGPNSVCTYLSHNEKIGLRGFRPAASQTGMYSQI